MIEVRIRNTYEGTSRRLGEVPFTKEGLASALHLLRDWGLTSEDALDEENAFGQFRLDKDAAYFEIVVPGTGEEG